MIDLDRDGMWFVDRLESVTRWPSIPNLHTFHWKTGEVEPNIHLRKGVQYTVSEKIDGTNIRIGILSDRTWFLGTRNRIIAMSECGITDDANGAISWFKKVAPLQIIPGLQNFSLRSNLAAIVIYGELYGGNIQRGRKIYGGDDVDFRIFAMKSFPGLNRLMVLPPENTASLREGWALGETEFKPFTRMAHTPFSSVPLIKTVDAGDIPLTPRGTYEWLKDILGEETHAPLGEGGNRRPEGVVLYRIGEIGPQVFKVRLEDYEKILRKRGKL